MFTNPYQQLQVLDVIAPPYTPEFVHLFLPLIENDGITGTLRSEDGNDLVSEFICKYIDMYTTTRKVSISPGYR